MKVPCRTGFGYWRPATFLAPFLTCGFSRGNQTGERRVAYATWWPGDDVVWNPRPECEVGRADAPFAAMTPGTRPDPAQFPILWTEPTAD